MTAPAEVKTRKVTPRGPQWLTATELHSYVRDTYGVNLNTLKGSHPTFQSWAKKHNVRRREFKFVTLTPAAQQKRVERVENGSYTLYQKPAAVLKRCRYEFNMSDIYKLVRKLQPRV